MRNKNKKNGVLRSESELGGPKVKKADKIEIFGRRGFIKKLWGVLGLVAGAEMIYVISGFFSPNKKPLTQNFQFVEAGNVIDFQLNAAFPFRNGKFYLVRLNDGGFIALSIKCTHLGCSVRWDEKKKEFFCPCHASTFDQTGELLKPPAPRALDFYKVIINNGKIIVDVSKAIKRNAYDKIQVAYG